MHQVVHFICFFTSDFSLRIASKVCNEILTPFDDTPVEIFSSVCVGSGHTPPWIIMCAIYNCPETEGKHLVHKQSFKCNMANIHSAETN